MRVEFHPEAEAEFGEYAKLYEFEVTGLGTRFVLEVQRASNLLATNPELGQEIQSGFRHFVLADFPHSLIYSIEQELIWIIAIAHQKRRPGYWKKRIAR